MTKDATMNCDHISERTICVVWREERLLNVDVLQGVFLSNHVLFQHRCFLLWWQTYVKSVVWLQGKNMNWHGDDPERPAAVLTFGPLLILNLSYTNEVL
jgi:hypothetical protein